MESAPSAHSLEEALLARASEDWMSAADVIEIVRSSGLKGPGDLRDLALGLVARLIATDELVPGERDGSTHRPWEGSPAEAIARIVGDWGARSDPLVAPGEVVWLRATGAVQGQGDGGLGRPSG